MSCPPLFRRIGFFVGQVNQKTKEHGSMPAGPEAKESPGFFDLMAFRFRSPNYRKRGSASYIVREVHSVREREREIQRERERERERKTEVTSPLSR